MKRKLPVLLLAAAMVVGISSCGETTSEPTTSTDTTESTTSVTDSTSDTTSVDEKYVSRIELAQVPTTTILSVGDTIDLQEYVTVHYSDGTTSHTDFTASVRTTGTVTLDADGHTLNITSHGDIRVAINSGDLSSNFTATAYSEVQKEVYEAMGEGVNNATFILVDATSAGTPEISRAYKDSTYYAYNYFADEGTFDVAVQSLTDSDGSKVGAYEGVANGDPADADTVITYTPGKFSWNNYRYGMTVANVGLGLTAETIEYYGADGQLVTEDIWAVSSSQQDEFLANAMMLSLSGSGETTYFAANMYDITLSTGEESRVPGFELLTLDKNKELSYYGTLLVTDIGTTAPEALVASLTDPSMVPQVINVDEVTDFVSNTVTTGSYTLTSTTTLLDDEGNPYTDSTALSAWEQLYANYNYVFTTGTEVVQVTSDTVLSTLTPSSISSYGAMQFGVTDHEGTAYLLQQYTNSTSEAVYSADALNLGYDGTDFWGFVEEVGAFTTLAASNSADVMSTVEATSKQTNEGVTNIAAVGGVFLSNLGSNTYFTVLGLTLFGSYENPDDPNSTFHSLLESLTVQITVSETSLKLITVVSGGYLGLEGNLYVDLTIDNVGSTTVDLSNYQSLMTGAAA